MTITEKELGQRLRDEFNSQDATFEDVARRAAELLGVTLADGPLASGFYRHKDGQVVHLRDDSTPYNIEAHVESDWALRNRDALTPARVISEADFQRLVSIRADEDANPGDAQYAPAKPPVLTERDLEEAYRRGGAVELAYASFSDFPSCDREALLRMSLNLLAKHGGARELPGRDDVKQESVNLTETEIQVRHAISDSLKHGLKLPLASDVSEATSRVMDIIGPLLKGGGDE